MAHKKITAERIRNDYKRARIIDSRWCREAREDLKFALGEQWDKADKDALTSQGRPALTFNIIQPVVHLASGYQRQSRSAIRCYPEGGEDQLKSEIATALVKKISQRSKVENKLSLQFEEGIITGKGYIEPYVDYTNNLINGELKFRRRNPFLVKVDPDATEYDLSDAGFILFEDFYTREKLIQLFPEHKAKIRKIEPEEDPLESEEPTVGETGDLGLKKTSDEVDSTYDSVYQMDEEPLETDEELDHETLRYIEYQYICYTTKYLAADSLRGKMQIFDSKTEAELYLAQLNSADPITPERIIMLQQSGEDLSKEPQKVIERSIPELYFAFMIEGEVISDIPSPHYPQWKGFSLIPYYSNYTPLARTELKRDDLAFQGIVRQLKDPQKEKNKRRSQTLHHLNTSANSGWLTVKGAWVDPGMVDQLGSSAGVNLEYNESKQKPERITPVPLSQGHLVMEQAAEQDIKTISGINADMLAMEDKTTSGRAIALRQQQGTLMLKRIFDNFSWTQEIVGKFILTQLGKLFSVETAMQVLGSDFIVKNQVTPEIVNDVLTNADLGLYDVAIGEGQDSPTQRYANHSLLMEMVEKGFPIPPDVILDYADLPESAKKRTLGFMQQQQAMQQAAAATAPQPGAA